VPGTGLDAVLSDNEAGAAALTQALLDDGFRRIAFLGGDPAISTARERLAGFEQALAQAGLKAEDGAIRLGGMGIEDGYRRMDELLRQPDPPQALLAVNLLVHLGIQRRLLEQAGDFSAHPQPRFAIAAFDETPYSPFWRRGSPTNPEPDCRTRYRTGRADHRAPAGRHHQSPARLQSAGETARVRFRI